MTDLAAILERHAPPYVAKRKNATLGIGVCRDGESIARIFGVPKEDPVFEIGSITKVYTATLLATMVSEGLVSLDDPLVKHLPPAVTEGKPIWSRVTLQHLATHTSGLPRLPENLGRRIRDPRNPYRDFRVEDLHEGLTRWARRRPKSGSAAYSNFGMGLLGHILATKLGKSYEDALIDRILTPLGMNATRVTLSDEMKSRFVPGHSAWGRPKEAWDMGALAGAGALRSTVDDQVRFLRANIEAAPPLGRTFEMCHEVRHKDRVYSMGLGWHIEDVNGRGMHWHNGATGGFSSYMAFAKDARVGVVVLSNYTISMWSLIFGCAIDRIGESVMADLVGGWADLSGQRPALGVRSDQP